MWLIKLVMLSSALVQSREWLGRCNPTNCVMEPIIFFCRIWHAHRKERGLDFSSVLMATCWRMTTWYRIFQTDLLSLTPSTKNTQKIKRATCKKKMPWCPREFSISVLIIANAHNCNKHHLSTLMCLYPGRGCNRHFCSAHRWQDDGGTCCWHRFVQPCVRFNYDVMCALWHYSSH